MVAGGGGNGTTGSNGGAGAGELVFLPNQSISAVQQTVIIGNGGEGANIGQDTEFLGVSANGGGNTTVSGGSGGGRRRDQNGNVGLSVKTGNGYGNNGGNSNGTAWSGAGGGGGAGAAGTNGGGSNNNNEYPGNGGDGLNEVTIDGTLYNFATVFGGAIYGEVISGESWFAGGGGGSINGGGNGTGGGTGGKGGGGRGEGPTAGSYTSDYTEPTSGMRHTGGGAGGDLGGTSINGGSGIVLVKFTGNVTTGKTIPKVTGASFDSTNVTFTVQGSMSDIKYTINGGSEQTTPVGTLAVAHGLSMSASITVVAYAVDANGDQISAKKTATYTPPPTPTYTASFSTNELTLTASIASITNAHNSFAITLERDDGTVLQTHTLVNGETGFTFTQTETSYATYNYIVKINGTQTDTYSATYTPPPTLKWNFSDKHDGTAEGFGTHDDQTPPCYVEKASDGTWSLTLTGDLANRQDQNPGNNWDYIETIGGTVYLKYKGWDAGGYFNGPYTRAQWSSSIGSETIRIYEHSSYSETYNNGIYLIQESS